MEHIGNVHREWQAARCRAGIREERPVHAAGGRRAARAAVRARGPHRAARR